MALTGMGLGFVFTAHDLASGTMRRIGTNLGGLQGQASAASFAIARGMTAMAAGAGILAVGLGGLAVMGSVAMLAGEFDAAMAQAGARARSSAGDLALMRQAALDVSGSGRSTFDPTQSAQGLELLAAAGLTAQESIQGLAPALGLATAGNITVESSARAMVSALRVFSLDASMADRVANQMLAISNSTLLEARDLEAAMGAVGRGAVQAGQRIEEMLPAMGLVRNSGVSAEVAAHAVSSSLIYMSTHARDRFNDLGVSLTDASGRFRPFLDIVMETNTALASVTDQAERAEMVNRLFGRFGMTAFSAITAQLEAGIRSQLTGEVLRGAAAVAELRRQMETAGGTIDYFLDRTLNTLPGQLQVLRAVAKTVAVELGTPLALAIKPVVAGIVEGLQRFRAVWTGLPESFRTGAVRLFLLGSALMTAFGGVVILSGVIAIMIPMAKVMLITLGSIALVLLPIGAGFAAVVGSIYLFNRAVNENVGGLGRLVSLGQRVSLFFRGLNALMSEGGFSGALRKELNAKGNEGLRAFVLQVGAAAYRIEAFFRGIAKGVDIFLTDAAPELRALVDSVTALAAELGLTETALTGITKESSKTFGNAGLGAGRDIIDMFREMVDGIRKVVDFLAGVSEGISAAADVLVKDSILTDVWGVIASGISWVTTELFGLNTEMITARDIGYAVGVGLVIIFGALAIVLGVVVIALGLIVIALVAFAAVWVVTMGLMLIPLLPVLAALYAIYRVYTAIRGQPTLTIADIRAGAGQILPVGAPDFTSQQAAQSRAVSAQQQAALGRAPSGVPVLDARTGTGLVQDENGAALVARLTQAIERRPAPPPPKMTVVTMLDAEVIARHVTRAQATAGNRTFAPAGSGGEE